MVYQAYIFDIERVQLWVIMGLWSFLKSILFFAALWSNPQSWLSGAPSKNPRVAVGCHGTDRCNRSCMLGPLALRVSEHPGCPPSGGAVVGPHLFHHFSGVPCSIYNSGCFRSSDLHEKIPQCVSLPGSNTTIATHSPRMYCISGYIRPKKLSE